MLSSCLKSYTLETSTSIASPTDSFDPPPNVATEMFLVTLGLLLFYLISRCLLSKLEDDICGVEKSS